MFFGWFLVLNFVIQSLLYILWVFDYFLYISFGLAEPAVFTCIISPTVSKNHNSTSFHQLDFASLTFCCCCFLTWNKAKPIFKKSVQFCFIIVTHNGYICFAIWFVCYVCQQQFFNFSWMMLRKGPDWTRQPDFSTFLSLVLVTLCNMNLIYLSTTSNLMALQRYTSWNRWQHNSLKDVSVRHKSHPSSLLPTGKKDFGCEPRFWYCCTYLNNVNMVLAP